jgi:hypothetical protein
MSADTDFTDEQRAEWRVLSDQEIAAREAFQEAECQAGGWLIHAITHPDSTDFARQQADKSARDAIRLLAEWRRLTVQANATPYGAHLSAVIDARLAARRAERVA